MPRFDMERSENAAFDSSAPSEPQLDCLANSLVQLLETAKRDLDHDLGETGGGTGGMSCSDWIVTVEQKTTRIGGTDAGLREADDVRGPRPKWRGLPLIL